MGSVNFDESAIAANVEQSLIAENAELKRLLKSAMNDLSCSRSCAICLYATGSQYVGCYGDICAWKWQHAAEAEKLLGGESDDGE